MIVTISLPTETLLVGEAEEIKAVYSSMHRAWMKDRLSARPRFVKKPRFTPGKVYGISIYAESSCAWQDRCEDRWFQAVNSDTITRTLVANQISTIMPSRPGKRPWGK